jgi:hypothetical protein
MHDRTYYRHCETRTLIELARDSNHELCIAIGERLESKRGLSEEIDEMRDRLDLATAAASAMRSEIAALEAEIAYLRENNAAIEGE